MDSQITGQHRLTTQAAPKSNQNTAPTAIFLPDGTNLLTYIQSLQTQITNQFAQIAALDTRIDALEA